MNFEKFYRLVCTNWYLLPNKKQTLLYLCYHYDLLLWKRKKLKLGAVAFVIKEYKFDEVLLWEDAEIRFINQDTTLEDERKIEVIFKKLGWEWNAKNYVALFVVLIIALTKIIRLLRYIYGEYLPSLAFRDTRYDYFIKYSFEEVYSFYAIGFLRDLAGFNYWLINVLTTFAVEYNIIF
jgi:hypothetical protein